MVAQLDFFKTIKNTLERHHIQPEVFYEIHKNPVKSDVYAGTTVMMKQKEMQSLELEVARHWMLPEPLYSGLITVKTCSNMMT